MATCELCGNDYDKTFDVVIAGTQHTFDSFECAIHALAPACAHCGCKVVGHGRRAGRDDLLLRALRRGRERSRARPTASDLTPPLARLRAVR